jgi:hypothetical protein
MGITIRHFAVPAAVPTVLVVLQAVQLAVQAVVVAALLSSAAAPGRMLTQVAVVAGKLGLMVVVVVVSELETCAKAWVTGMGLELAREAVCLR